MNDSFKIYELTEEEVETYVNTHGKVDPSSIHIDDRKNVLLTAVMVNDVELVRDCLAIDVDVSNPKLLEHSAYYGYYEVVKLLLEKGADPTGAGCVALLVSKARCHYKTSNLINQYLRKYKINKLINDNTKKFK